jgi:cell division protein FtsI (penicillin-binding protein 3)
VKTCSSDRKRLLFLSLFVIMLFAVLIVQFYHIQIIEGEKWSKTAEKQHYFLVKEPFMRGRFISNTAIKKGHPETAQSFVIDVQKFHLYADPLSIPAEHREAVAGQIASTLHLDDEEKKELSLNLDRKSRSRKLAMWLDKESHDELLNWWHPFAKANKIPRNALFFASDYQRSYPFGKLLGQVLHTVQNVKDEKTLQALPTGGLELYFNPYLKGKPGKRRLMRSPRNSLETGEVISIPQNGADIYLTINHCLQAIAEEEIEKGVKKSKAKSGWAVMMDPYSGEVLALAQYPFFSPSDYQRYFNDDALIQDTKVKAVTDANEPGSIMKPITMAVALKANEELIKRGEKPLFDPEDMMPTSNPYFPGRKKPLKDLAPYAFLDMNMAVQKSSNIYVARLAEKIVQRLGKEWYRQVLYEDFGFGQKTGIELPSESAGLLPRIGFKHPNGTFEWSVSTPYSLAMGHNIQTNSLQILRVFAMFANGGYLLKPTLIRKIIKTNDDGSQEILVDNTRNRPKHRVITEDRARQIIKAIKYTTKNGGTGKRADVWGYTDGGKSGTADKAIKGIYDPHYVCSSFVGVVPAENPAFVLIVTLDEPEYGYEPGQGRKHLGGFCSAPIFQEIAQRSLAYLGTPPNDPFGYPPGDPRRNSEKADWAPEIRQLQEKYKKWNMPGK